MKVEHRAQNPSIHHIAAEVCDYDGILPIVDRLGGDGLDFLINNAGIAGSETPEERRFLSATTLDDARQVMETDCFAQADMSRAFIPLILANGGGALVNILSIGALFCLPEYSSYSAAKAAASVMTQGLRAELAHQNIFVAGVYTAGVDTRMGAKNNEPKVSPVIHARQVLDSVAEGEEDIFAGVRADEIRDQLQEQGVVLEDSREGTYWKYA